MKIPQVGVTPEQLRSLTGQRRGAAGSSEQRLSSGSPTGSYGSRGVGVGRFGVKELTDQEILNQSRELLEAYYSQNPEAKELVDQGVVPDYWGVEQTGQRIFDLLVNAFGGDDPEAFVAQARAVLETAYGDAERIFGALPGLVGDTRQALFAALEAVANGTSLDQARAGIGVVE